MPRIQFAIVFTLIIYSCTTDPCSEKGIRSLAGEENTTELLNCADSLRSNEELRRTYYEVMMDNSSMPLFEFARQERLDPWMTIKNGVPILSYMRSQNLDCLAYEFEVYQFVVWNEQQERYNMNNLVLALHQGNVPVVDAFLRTGYPAQRTVGNDILPIIVASMQGNYNVVKLLLKYNADPNASFNNQPALLLASRNGHAETAKILIDAGADVDATNDLGQTSLMVAAENSHRAVVKLLKSYAADRSFQDKSGKTALDYAKQSGDKDVITLLN